MTKGIQPLASLAKYGSRTAFHVNSVARALLPRDSEDRLYVRVEPTIRGGIRITPSDSTDTRARRIHQSTGQFMIPTDAIPTDKYPTFWTLTKAKNGTLVGTRQEAE